VSITERTEHSVAVREAGFVRGERARRRRRRPGDAASRATSICSFPSTAEIGGGALRIEDSLFASGRVFTTSGRRHAASDLRLRLADSPRSSPFPIRDRLPNVSDSRVDRSARSFLESRQFLKDGCRFSRRAGPALDCRRIRPQRGAASSRFRARHLNISVRRQFRIERCVLPMRRASARETRVSVAAPSAPVKRLPASSAAAASLLALEETRFALATSASLRRDEARRASSSVARNLASSCKSARSRSRRFSS